MFRKSLAGVRVGLVLLAMLIATTPARAIAYIDDTAAG
jgi:hypothetical protein